MKIAHAEASSAVTIRLAGGLGNQLFGYGVGRATAQRLRCPLLLDISSYSNQTMGVTPRDFELNWLADSSQITNSIRIQAKSRLMENVYQRIPLLAPKNQFIERSFAYDPRIELVKPGTTLVGYFQSWRYFDAIGDELRNLVTHATPKSPWFEVQSRALNAMRPWIALHVRRGDYTMPGNSRYHGLLNSDYYRSALSVIRSESIDHQLVVFSDDIHEARKVLGEESEGALFIEPPIGAHSMESISLMSQADSVIAANSSFSWWGAWLANPGTTKVIVPTPWFTGAGNDERDLCPPHWVRLPLNERNI